MIPYASYVTFGFAFFLIMFASYVGNQYRSTILDSESLHDYDMIKKYVLNDSPLYGNNKPKLWIHSKYEVNARSWKNFMSRNTTDLNQPYLSLTIESIIRYCSDDFHICLIDDDSFETLIPSWDINLKTIPEPKRTYMRDIAMIQLLNLYGGMIVPNSFLCLKSLIPLYKEGIKTNRVFVLEEINHSSQLQSSTFIPTIRMMGSTKDNEEIKNLLIELKKQEDHFSQETSFLNTIGNWCINEIDESRISCIDGTSIGVKSSIGKPIRLEDLMEENYLDVDSDALYGILIPYEELLRRPKFQWFSILPKEDILKSRIIIAQYFQASKVSQNTTESNIMSL